MRAIVMIAAAILIQSPAALAAAADSPYFSCLGTSSQAVPTPAQLRAFGAALHTQFESTFATSDEEIQKNIDCLNGKASPQDCTTRLEYFNKTLPVQLTKYRENLALTSWNPMFRASPDREQFKFNVDLNKPHTFWMEQVKPQPLTGGEILQVQGKFDAESARIFKVVQMEAQEQARLMKDQAMAYSDAIVGANMLGEKDWMITLLAGGIWGQIMEMRFEQLVFHLNKKRMIQRLVEHPILAFIAEPVDSRTGVITKDSLIKALSAMRENLHAERSDVTEMFRVSDRGQFLPGNPHGGTSAQGRYMWSQRGLFPLMDYSSVVESLLFTHPEFCSAATKLFNDNNNEKFWNTIIFAGVTFGVLLIMPPMIGAAGMIILQGYYIYSANEERKKLVQAAFTNPQQSLSLRSPEEAYLQADDELTEVILSPLAITAIPAFRLTRVLRFMH